MTIAGRRPKPRRGGLWGSAYTAIVAGAFVVAMHEISVRYPHPADGPTPPSTRVATFVALAGVVFGLALVPLVAWLAARPRRRAELRWRVVAAIGVALAVGSVALAIPIWAHPPHNLRECFRDYYGDNANAPYSIVCESGRLNRPLGERRLDEGILGGLVILFLTGLAVQRTMPPPSVGTEPGRTIPARPSGRR